MPGVESARRGEKIDTPERVKLFLGKSLMARQGWTLFTPRRYPNRHETAQGS